MQMKNPTIAVVKRSRGIFGFIQLLVYTPLLENAHPLNRKTEESLNCIKYEVIISIILPRLIQFWAAVLAVCLLDGVAKTA